MMGAFISPDDLEPFAQIDLDKAVAMVDDAEAMAVLAAPCLSVPEFQNDPTMSAVVKAILRGAILRWDESGAGALTQRSRTGGPFSESESIDTRTKRKAMFWPSEITQLRDLCATFSGSADKGRAFTVDTAPKARRDGHADVCDLNLGWPYCSCGAYLTQGEYPLYEGGAIS